MTTIGRSCNDNSEDQTTLSVIIDTDAYPEDTTVSLKDLTTGERLWRYRNDWDSYTQYEIDESVEESHCYEVLVEDDMGDGLCCSYGSGGVSVRFDGEMQGRISTFTYSKTIRVGDCP